ncbi:MAG: hypothetical protein LBG13_03225 [Holosporales bacterium]|jgi:hypothetical protein|nr:hypothetical protein [Holosporales bacterium]
MNKKLFGIVGLVLVAGVLGGGKAAADNEGYIFLYDGIAFNKATSEYEVTYGPYPAVEARAKEVAREIGEGRLLYKSGFEKYVDGVMPSGELSQRMLTNPPPHRFELLHEAAGWKCRFFCRSDVQVSRARPYLESWAKFKLFTKVVRDEQKKLKKDA